MNVFINGKFVPEKKAVVSINDHGFLYGDGVYETIQVRDGLPLLLDEHLRRLHRSARGLKLKAPGAPVLKKAIGTLVRKNKLSRGIVRITLTRGPGAYGFDPRLCPKPTLVITARPFAGYPESFYRRGIKAAIVSVRRNSPRALPPSIKSTSCLNGILAKMESIKAGAHEGILLSERGYVAEGTVSNVFFLKKKTLLTPALEGDLLPGVTRGLVMKLARRAGFRVVEKNVTPRELLSADAIFLTSALMDVMPVSRVVWKGRTYLYKINFSVSASLPATNNRTK